MPTHLENSLITTAEAAELLGVHVETARRWSNDGRLTTVRTPGGHRRHPIEAVLSLKGCSMKFLHITRPVEWIWETWSSPKEKFPLYPTPVLIKESEVGPIQFGDFTIDRPCCLASKSHYNAIGVFCTNFGTTDSPVYNGVAGYEHLRGLHVYSRTTLDLPCFSEVFHWGDTSPLKFYFLPETAIVGAIEEQWMHPRTGKLSFEMAHVLVDESCDLGD